MEYYRIKQTGERVYISQSKEFASRPNDTQEMIYRVKDGYALWGLTRADIITEKEWLSNKTIK